MKNTSEQANAALEAGTVTQDQYDALQREIIETQRALEDMETQAAQSTVALQKISVIGTKFQEAGGRIESVGKSLLPVTTAITGIGVAGIKVASDFEKAMSGVQAITGATGEDFEALREKAIELGATTSFSAGEVAEAMTGMAKAGWTTTQIIDGTDVLSRMSGQSTGDIVIPVYLGGNLLDEVIVDAQQRMNLRSGGR